MALPLPLDPSPVSIEALAARLPAPLRARIAWFPAELRRSVVEPLRRAAPRELESTVDDVSIGAVRAFLGLGSIVAELLEDPRLTELLWAAPAQVGIPDRVRARLGAVDPIAADDLAEAHEWLRVILAAFARELGAQATLVSRRAADIPVLSDDEIRSELRGPSGSLMRGMLLTVAAVDVVLGDEPFPAAITRWCALALREMQAAANALRAHGVAVPTAVVPQGASAGAWHRRRWSTRFRPEPLPPGVHERLVDVLAPEEIWLFGSRARGTHGPNSDWDLLVVVPDAAEPPADLDRLLAQLSRERVEVFLARRSEVEEGRQAPGSLAYIATTEGYRLYGP